jgi:hypothetical protein
MTANETTLRAKLAKNPGSLLFAWLAEELRQSRNLDAALPVVEEGLARNSDFLPGLLVRGKILFDMNALEEAEATFRKVFRKDPFCLSAVRGLADIATKLNRKPQAEQYLRILHVMDPLDESLPPVAPLVPTALIPRAVPLEDDPFALLAPAPVPDTTSDGPTALELAGMLDAALDGVDRGPSQPEFFPADDDASVTSTDVGSAISSLFGGLSASAKPIAPEAEIGGESPFSKMSAPPPRASVSPPPAVPVVPSPVQAPEASDLHGALDSLFGDDDDFVEESASPSAPVAMAAPAAEPEPAAPPPAVAPAGKQELETDLASALDDLFGEDDAFEEPTLTQAASTPGEPSASITASGSDQSLDLDALLNEQLSSKSALPDFSSNISDALNGPVSDEELPGFGSLASLSGHAPDLDALLNEQLSSKSALPDFSSNISDALNGPVSDEELPGFGSPPAGLSGRSPDLDALLNEQLSSKSALPDFSSNISDALNGPVSDEELPGFGSLASLSGHAPDLDALLNEQLSSKSALPDFSSNISDALNGSVSDEELPGFGSPPAGLSGRSPDLDALLNEQLSSKSELPDFSSNISDALNGPVSDEELPGFGSLGGLSGRSPDLDALLNQQLSSKSDLPDFSSDISDALNGPVSEDELPGFSSLPNISGNSLDLDSLLDEQLSFQSDLPDIGDDIANILNAPSPLEAPGKAPDLDALLNEQLSSKSNIPDFSADISAALEEPAQSYDLQEKSVEPASSSGGANDFSSEVKGVLDNLFADDDLDLPHEPASKAASEQSSDLKEDVGNAFDSLFDDDADELLAELAAQDRPVAPQAAPVVPEVEKEAPPAPAEEPAKEAFDDVASALDRLFADDDSLDSLFSDDNDEILRQQLQNNPADSIASVANEGGPQKLTPTLAEIYLQQGLVGKALQAYRELVAEKPNDKHLQARLAEIEKLARQS